MNFTVSNNSVLLIDSNYWESEYAQKGFFFLSANAGALRLLVPDSFLQAVDEMKTGKFCELSRARGGIELLFDDGSDAPYSIVVDTKQTDRGIGRAVKAELLIYGRGPTLLHRMPAVIKSI